MIDLQHNRGLGLAQEKLFFQSVQHHFDIYTTVCGREAVVEFF